MVGRIARVALLPLALVAVVVVATMVGAVRVSPPETVQILAYKLGLHLAKPTWPIQDEYIIWSIRLPRVLEAALVGAGLAVAGTLFQAVLRNPLADPYVIGTSAGAQAGVAVALLFALPSAVFGAGALQLCAFVGALGTVLVVYAIARTAGQTPIVTLLLAGFVVSSFLISATTLLLEMSGRITEILGWTMGGITTGDSAHLTAIAVVMAAATFAAFLLAPQLDVLLLGETQATYLGVRVERLKLIAIMLASLLTGLTVTLAGVVAFVGLVVPHAARLVYGPSHRILLPMAATGGGIFLVLADLVARSIIPPTEIPLGVVTAVIGAPFFLYLLRRSKREYSL